MRRSSWDAPPLACRPDARLPFRATNTPDSLVNLPAAIIWCTAPAAGTWLGIRSALSGDRVAILAALISAFFLVILLIATPGVLY